MPFCASLNASRVTSVIALGSPRTPASPKRRSASNVHGDASASIAGLPPLRSLHRAATAPNLTTLAAATRSKFSHPPSTTLAPRTSAAATAATSPSVGAADRTQSHTSTRPRPMTHARADAVRLPSHPAGSHPSPGRKSQSSFPPPVSASQIRRTDSIPSFKPTIARAVVTNASGTPRSPTCLYAPRTSSAENAGEQYVSARLGSPLGSLVSTRAHACSYPGDDSSVRFSSHTFRNASPAPSTSPSLCVARTTTVNSSAPPAPPPREALGSSKSALSGALLLGELASTLDAVSLAAAPGVSSSRAVRPASCLSRAASSHSSGDAVSGGFVRTVDVETSLSNCLDLSPVRVPLTR